MFECIKKLLKKKSPKPVETPPAVKPIEVKAPVAISTPIPVEPPVVSAPPVNPIPSYYQTALVEKEKNVKEILGRKHSPRILEYHQATDLKATEDEVSWCSSFVNWCLKQNGIKGTNKANARSFLEWGKKVPVTTPKVGDIVVFWRGDKDGWLGHVGFYAGEKEDKILVLGGNQGNEVNFSYYKKSQLLGYRRPS